MRRVGNPPNWQTNYFHLERRTITDVQFHQPLYLREDSASARGLMVLDLVASYALASRRSSRYLVQVGGASSWNNQTELASTQAELSSVGVPSVLSVC